MVSRRLPERRSYAGEYRRIGDRRRIESLRVSENKRKKVSYPAHYRGRDTIRASIREYQTDRELNPCEYRRLQDRNDGIRASIGEEIKDEESNPCEYWRIKERKHPLRASIGEYQIDRESNPCEYRRIQDRNDGIRASTGEEIVFGRVPKSNRQTGNQSVRVLKNPRQKGCTGESKTEMMISGRVPEKRSYSGEYKRVTDRRGINPSEYCRIQDRKDGIRASTREEIVFGRVSRNRRKAKNRIRASTGE
ncbi:hypothetical protein PVL29_012011 [Vitis rotundifolia]|uniref:Uncharacterized protein n=1 Tax=Vitis rotundifolia TaxID=103349 RepID=A0AA39DR57_VITRO|nr:hypothetical protein PVL29_012011 [Vitis rotundifolia]